MQKSKHRTRRYEYEGMISVLALGNPEGIHVYKLSQLLKCSLDTAVKNLRRLEQNGFLITKDIFKGKRKTVMYQFNEKFLENQAFSIKRYTKLPKKPLEKFLQSNGFKTMFYNHLHNEYPGLIEMAKEGYESNNLEIFINECKKDISYINYLYHPASISTLYFKILDILLYMGILDLLLNAFQTHPNIPKEIKQQMEVVKNDG